jgi:methyl-accepting chemotaxis protein
MELSKLTLKIVVVLTVLIIGCMLVFSSMFIESQYSRLRDNIIENGRIFALFSAQSIYNDYVALYTHPSAGEFEVFKDSVKSKLEGSKDIVKVSLVSTNGRILFDSDEFEDGKYSGSPRLLNDNSTLELLKSDEIAQAPTTFRGRAAVEIAVPIPEVSGHHILSVRYILSLERVDNEIANTYMQMIAVLLPVIIISLIIVVFFSIRLVRPIAHLTTIAKKIGKGDMDIKIDIKSNDEIGELAKSFEEMASDLKKSHDQIKQHAEDLEIQVKERTKELEEKNIELERFNKLAVGRELKMIELKKKLGELERKK